MPSKSHGALVRDVMSPEVRSLGRNDSLSVADETMTRLRVRHLPVLDDDGNLAGVVSRSDLFRGALVKALGYGSVAQKRILESVVVKEVMTTDVITIPPDTSLAEAAKLLIEKKVGCLPVMNEGKLVGILTEGDFVALAAKPR